MKRKLIQVYAAVLYNANVKGFIKGGIFSGASKAVCVPGLNCYSCPGAIGSCPLGALQNALAASGHRAPFYVFGILALYGLIFGRAVCGWLCPVGLIQELLHRIPTPKIRKSRVTRGISCFKYLILAYFVLAVPLASIRNGAAVPGFCKYICPAGTLEGGIRFVAENAGKGLLGDLGALFTWKCVIAVALVTLAVFMYRAFCRFVCPLGAIYSLFSRFALLGVRVDATRCTDCGKCVAECEMDVRHVGDRECVQCGKCMDACPTKAISWKNGKIVLAGNEIVPPRKEKQRKSLHILLVILAAAALLWALWYGNFSPETAGMPEAAAVTAADGTVVGPEVGMRCPDFEVPMWDTEEKLTLADCLGKPTVINLWAAWCGGCVTEMPAFQRLWETYGDRVKVVAVHSAGKTDDMGKMIGEGGYTFAFAVDEGDRMIASLGGSTALPQTVVLDAEGRIVYNRVGAVTYEQIEATLRLLTEGNIPAEGTEAANNTELSTYTVLLTDREGLPVAGAKLQICTASLCRLMTTDENGKAVFTDVPDTYEVEIQRLPTGYIVDTAGKYTLKPEGDTLTLTVEKGENQEEWIGSLW